MKCYICEKEINNNDNNHIYRCAKNNGVSLDKNEIKLNQLKFHYSIDFNYSLLFNLYIEKEYSLPDFKKEFGLSYKQTSFLLDYFGIKRRNISEAYYQNRKVEKTKRTLIKKFGVDNASKSNIIKQKKKETFLQNYGVENIWKSKEYYQWLHEYMEDKYGKKSLPNKYGNMQKWWNKQTEEYKKEHMKPANKAYKKFWENASDEIKNEIIQRRCKEIVCYYNSSLETRIAKILDMMQISYERQKWIKNKSYDFRINKTNVIIEVQGDFWHANPNIYNDEDVLNFPGGIRKASDLWDIDKKKKRIAEDYGYQMIYFWESELNELDDSQLLILMESRLDESRKDKIYKKDSK